MMGGAVTAAGNGSNSMSWGTAGQGDSRISCLNRGPRHLLFQHKNSILIDYLAKLARLPLVLPYRRDSASTDRLSGPCVPMESK